MAKAVPSAKTHRTTDHRTATEATAGAQAGARAVAAGGDERCECGEALVRIDLLIDGEDITMRSCSVCDRRSWHRGGEQVELKGVLADLSSLPTRYRRDLANR